VQSRLTVDEDDNEELLAKEDMLDHDALDEYDDIVHETLNPDDRTNALFKNILKRDGGFKSFGARDSVLSAGHAQRNSYTSRFSSKYGDNRLYLQRLSRNSIDSSQGQT